MPGTIFPILYGAVLLKFFITSQKPVFICIGSLVNKVSNHYALYIEYVINWLVASGCLKYLAHRQEYVFYLFQNNMRVERFLAIHYSYTHDSVLRELCANIT